MNFQKVLLPVAGVLVVAAAYRSWGWQGVLLVLGGIVFWLLLHFNRMLQALKRAAKRPIGYVDSAVMLNAKLRADASLLHVVSLTRSLGELLSPEQTQPEIFRWTDAGGSQVRCEFQGGRLRQWQLQRPETSEQNEAEAGAMAPAP